MRKKQLLLMGCSILFIVSFFITSCGIIKDIQMQKRHEEQAETIEVDETESYSEIIQIDEETEYAVFITTNGNNFLRHAYIAGSANDITPSLLIQRISEITGWSLTMTEELEIHRYEVIVKLKADSCVFTGQQSENKVYQIKDEEQFVKSVEASIEKTFRMNYSMNKDVVFVFEKSE